jgi:hypothetical protein
VNRTLKKIYNINRCNPTTSVSCEAIWWVGVCRDAFYSQQTLNARSPPLNLFWSDWWIEGCRSALKISCLIERSSGRIVCAEEVNCCFFLRVADWSICLRPQCLRITMFWIKIVFFCVDDRISLSCLACQQNRFWQEVPILFLRIRRSEMKKNIDNLLYYFLSSYINFHQGALKPNIHCWI